MPSITFAYPVGTPVKVTTRDARIYIGRFHSRNKEFLLLTVKDSSTYHIPRGLIRRITRLDDTAYGFGSTFLWGTGKKT